MQAENSRHRFRYTKLRLFNTLKSAYSKASKGLIFIKTRIKSVIQELQYFPSKTKNPLEFTIHKRTSQQVAAFKLGNLIQQNIHNSDFKGKVLAVFSNTIYLQDNDEEV